MTWTDNMFRGLLQKLVSHGTLIVSHPSGKIWTFGDGAQPKVAVTIRDSHVIGELLRDPELRFGEMYTDARLTVEEGSFFDLLSLILQHGTAARSSVARHLLDSLRNIKEKLGGGRNGIRRSRSNVQHHYDLNAAFYELFLDADRQYSCAYFEEPGQSLEAAQRAKCRHIASKLLMKPGVNVLDIGCGWGGLGLYLAAVGGAASVTGVTLSDEQLAVARQRAEAGGFSEVDFRLEDYRRTAGSFDRIVSVGMFEHVGANNYDTFFRKASDLLADDGVMLLHTIGHASPPGATNPWITQYIFPGGHLPALSEIVESVQKSGLMVSDVEVLRLHYADTLKEWRRRFMEKRDLAVKLYDDRFCRMWECYLCISEAAFRFLDVVVFQLQLTRRNDVVPLTRDYIARGEADLRARESDAATRPIPLPVPVAAA